MMKVGILDFFQILAKMCTSFPHSIPLGQLTIKGKKIHIYKIRDEKGVAATDALIGSWTHTHE